MKLTIKEIQEEYLNRCKACLTPKFNTEYYILKAEARAYGDAIKHILGGIIWIQIIDYADNNMPADVATLAGIPVNFPEYNPENN